MYPLHPPITSGQSYEGAWLICQVNLNTKRKLKRVADIECGRKEDERELQGRKGRKETKRKMEGKGREEKGREGKNEREGEGRVRKRSVWKEW